MNKIKTIAEIQADRKMLEQDVIILKTKTDENSRLKLEAKEAKLALLDSEAKTAELEAADAKRLEIDADKAIAAMESAGELHCQGANATARKAELKSLFTKDPSSIQLLAGNALKKAQGAALNAGGSQNNAQALNGAPAAKVTPVAGALTAVDGRINQFALDAGASYGYQFNAGWSAREAIAGYAELQCTNTRLAWQTNDAVSMQKKRDLALAAGNWYKAHLSKETSKWDSIPGWGLQKMVNESLQASDYTDPNNQLGTLSGTLVLQRTLPVFAYQYPEFFSMYTDFGDTPGLYKQTETTRIVVQPTVQVYNPALSGGRPLGWSTATEGSTTDVSMTLTDYVGVPIAIGNNILAATTRRLFDEQAVLAIKAIAGYLATMVTNLLTQANYGYYTNVNGTLVPNAYPTYPVTSQAFSLTDFNKLDAVFTSSKVPEDDRGILLNPTFYATLRNDTRLYFLYAASAKSIEDEGNFLAEARLPKLSGFAPYKAGYLPTTTPATNPTTSNVAGFAYQKAGIILKSRLPQDFATAVNAMIPGSITTVTDPDTKMSLMLVQYIQLQQNYAEWRPEVLLGTAVGDNRAGLVLTGQ